MHAPDLPYLPRMPVDYNPPIAMIGCGGITQLHLQSYRDHGLRVVALCDIDEDRARKRQSQYFPDAAVYTDYRDMLRRDDVEVVDIVTHPPERPAIVKDVMRSGRHVLSQKPFVLDLDVGLRLVELADRHNVRLAVNQNGRWAPHFSYANEAIRAGLLGDVSGVHLSVHWDHTGIVAGSEFEKVKHLILYDYAIHWFDIVQCFLADRQPLRVYGSAARTHSQRIWPNLLGQAIIEYDDAQVSMAFDGDTCFGPQDRTYIAGSRGSISSIGPGNREQTLTMTTADGEASPELKGSWFPDAFAGTMGELLCSIDENREPSNSARDNLNSLALCFAAVASAESHQAVVPGTVRKLPS